ncbi:hypothetical protein H0H10_25225 [Streptomyces sp. TRM S81-3]|uniref:Lipoprotein n=1 Tax=Streptomyces griseicoloratus TaxID=2752516 RepID=A0A926L7D1_9ACTN|nr:hypothetical protein [Streptomyces griseicoloratus]MBD0422419.1 hypothetical protein [Streptomyces griseicoloratus]
MLPSRRGRAARVTAALAVFLVTATAGAAVAGCGDTGGLRSAGATPTAVSPARLWPDLTPASSPAYDIGEVDHEVVKGVAVPGGDIRRADAVAAVRAEIAEHPDDYAGAKAPYRETARRMPDCGPEGQRGRCPVLTPYFRDLTGDGHPEMTLGFRLLPENMTAVRVYTVERGRLVRVMSYEDAVSAVELAGRSLIVRSPSEVAGYEYRLQWTWDPDQRAMLLTHDEMLRTAGGKRSKRPTAPPSPSPSAAPSASASASGP